MTPLSALMLAAATGRLGQTPRPEFAPGAAVTVVLASQGYPDNPVTGRPITGLDDAAALEGVTVLHAATGMLEGQLIATGGRVLNVVAIGDSFEQARARAYAGLSRIHLEGAQYRTDIAARVAR